jgi:hypothetical protein
VHFLAELALVRQPHPLAHLLCYVQELPSSHVLGNWAGMNYCCKFFMMVSALHACREASRWADTAAQLQSTAAASGSCTVASPRVRTFCFQIHWSLTLKLLPGARFIVNHSKVASACHEQAMQVRAHRLRRPSPCRWKHDNRDSDDDTVALEASSFSTPAAFFPRAASLLNVHLNTGRLCRQSCARSRWQQ